MLSSVHGWGYVRHGWMDKEMSLFPGGTEREHEILSRYLEQCILRNLQIVYFWSFLFNIFEPQLTAGN